jgi:hypothetical protein
MIEREYGEIVLRDGRQMIRVAKTVIGFGCFVLTIHHQNKFTLYRA